MTLCRGRAYLEGVKRAAFSALLGGAAILACGSDPAPPVTAPPDLFEYLRPPRSCAYQCPSTDCAELATPYVCPGMGPYASVPHDPACGRWDGKYPAVTAGKCTATQASGEAARYAGSDQGTTTLPDGHRLRPAGADWVFAEKDLSGGLTMMVARLPGTTFVVTVDAGYGDHAVRVIDPAKIGSGDPVLGYVRYAPPKTLHGAVAFVPPDLLYVATNDGVLQALKVNTTTGALAEDPRSITLPKAVDGNGKTVPWYASALAPTPDGKRLLVSGVTERSLLVYDVAAASPTFGQLQGSADLGGSETFGIFLDPADVAGTTAYVSMWDQKRVVEVDVSSAAAPVVKRAFATEKSPEGVAFLDARFMVVAGDLGDALSVVDRVSGTVTRVPVDAAAKLYGSEPTALAWDAPRKRLYGTLSGLNAVRAFDVDLGTTPPSLTPAGMLPAGFWPSGVVAMDDGALVIANLRGRGTGPRPLYSALGDSDIGDRMRGSIQKVSAPSAGDLSTGEANVRAYFAVKDQPGHPEVQCNGAPADFPVPATNAEGPSKVIDHIFFILRENKAFDGVLGDLPGVEGDKNYALKQGPGEMDLIWRNFRTLGKMFTIGDNYYTDAIYSTQGHVWATYGRTNDYNERTWAVSGAGRNARGLPGGGIVDASRPIEGSLFDWLDQNAVTYDLLGEIVGSPVNASKDHPPIDLYYPGGPFQNIGYPDVEKACHSVARARVLCDFGSFVYMTLTNDHTFGVGPTRATPETYVAVNDEATGMFLDGLSHSPLWASSVVFITEDDPSQGGEHIDSHRTPFVVVSPWVKRGYVSKTHIDMASLHKTFAHLLGKPYANALVESSAVPFDLFTSTPDYTPYTYKPRAWPLACGAGAQKDEVDLTESWDFTEEDQQLGLDAQVTRWMRHAPPITPAAKAKLMARMAR